MRIFIEYFERNNLTNDNMYLLFVKKNIIITNKKLINQNLINSK